MCSQQSLGPVGNQELVLLPVIAGHGASSVAQAVEGFGAPRALARFTVLTMMERLRRKGHLARRPADGGYRYSAAIAPGAAVRPAVQTFVDRTPGGTATRFVTCLAEREQLSEAEREALVASFQKDRRRRP